MPTSPPQPPKSSTSAPSSKKGSGKKSGRGASYKTVEFDRFVDKRIEKTRRVVKMADLFASLAVLLIGVISLLLVAAVAEHWLVSGGFGTNERTGLWAIMLIGSGVYFARYIFPLLTHRVNKLYAADELERESPELKNSLVNLLQLREQGTPSPVIQQMLEQQAAERLAVTEDHGVDLGPLLRVGYILTAVIALTGLYIVLSPKDFFTSAQRVILPWSEVAAPSRVAIEDLSPGDAVLSQGDRLPISLRIIGLEQDETAELIYTTSDGRVVEKRVSLSTEEGSVRYTTELPASQATLGLQSDLKYRIEAGDARTRDYQVEVLTTPTIAPQSIRYEYPEYTGFVNRTVEGGGDLRAIEGTRVTLMTEANMPIESAQIDFYADGRPDVRMKAEGQSATANFLMKRRGDSLGFSPEISNYVLRFTSTDGKTNRKPALYQREVIADLPPEARLLFPEEPVRSVKLDQSIEIAVEARDPDFALSGVWLRGEADGKQVLDEWLLKPRRRDKGHQGKYITSHWITPRKLGLVGGQTLDYWVEAADNREPSPNRNRSETQQLVIVAERDSGNPSEQGEGEQSDSGTPDGGQPQEGQNGEGQSGEGQSGQNQPGQNQPGQNESGQNESGENQSGEGESNQGSGEEGSAGNESSQKDGASEGEASENGDSENEASESDQDPGGIQGKGEEDAQGDRQNGTDSGDGTPTDQQNDESSDSNPNNQAGGNKRDGPRDPNQEQGVDDSNSPDSEGGEQVQTKDDSPVADDGSDDGAAFDKIREHLAKKRDATEEERNADDPNRQQQTDKQTGEQDQNKEQGQDAERPEAGDTKQGDPRDPTGEDPQRDPKQSPDESDQSENKSGKQSDSQSSESTNSAERGQDSKPNEGPRQGTGSSGQNQAADDGSGQSGDRGEGESSGRSGNQESSSDNQNNRPGEESTSEPSEGGRQGEASDSNDGKASSGDDKQGDGQSDSNGEGQRGTGSKASDGDADPDNKGNQDTEGNQPSSAGKDSQDNERDRESDLSDQKNNQQESRGGDPKGPSHSNGGKALDRPGTSEEGQEPGGDEANLDYARKQTDLVLDELSDQMDKQQIDQELLDELGWSEQDLQRFVNRWQERKRRAAESPGQSESELDAALRSLGMSPEGQRLNSSPKTNQDTLRDLQQGKRTSIPPALRERLQRYNRGVSRDQSR